MTFPKPSTQLKRHHRPTYATAGLLVLTQMRRMDLNQAGLLNQILKEEGLNVALLVAL
jgi:hypothetical protein